MNVQKYMLKAMEPGQNYTRKQLISAVLSSFPACKEGTFQWQLGEALKSGEVIRHGYNEYRLADGVHKAAFKPQYSELAADISALLDKTYPYVRFTIFETVLMNEFLNHLIAQNTIFVQAEKDSAAFLFRALQEAGYPNVMYKPAKRELALYWAKDCIVVADMVSEAPLSRESPHGITLEKMLVDMLCDKYVTETFSASELPGVLERAAGMYSLDRTRMLRYARRRNRGKELQALLEQIGM